LQDFPWDAVRITQIQRTVLENPDFGSVLVRGCEAVYTPRAGNQRYCQDPQCLQEVRRWQAAGRRKQRRLRPEVRKTQAAAAKAAGLRKSLLKLGPPLPAEHHGEAMVIQGSSFRTKGETPTSSRFHVITLLRQPWQRPRVPSGICRRPCSPFAAASACLMRLLKLQRPGVESHPWPPH
jgi:hypothetical protein